jgi:hypothetical protein
MRKHHSPTRKYDVTIIGTQPLLLHNDDIEWADRLEEWRLANGKKSSLGDWRPSSPTPGTFGMFSATIEQVL